MHQGAVSDDAWHHSEVSTARGGAGEGVTGAGRGRGNGSRPGEGTSETVAVWLCVSHLLLSLLGSCQRP